MLEAETQRSSCGIDGRRFSHVIPACIRLSAFLEPMRTCEVASLEWIIVLKPTHEQRFRSLLSSSKAQQCDLLVAGSVCVRMTVLTHRSLLCRLYAAVV